MTIKIFQRIFFFGLLMACWAGAAHAFQVTPAYRIIELARGRSFTGEAMVHNDEPVDLLITPSVKAWNAFPANKKIPIESWMKVDEKPFWLKRGESKPVKFNVTVPGNAVGEIAGELSFLTATQPARMVNLKISVTVYVDVKGTEKWNGSVAAFTITPSSGSLTGSVLVANKGNIHLRPSGYLQVFGADDEVVANLFINKGEPVTPGKTEGYRSKPVDVGLDPGTYKVVVTLRDVDRGKAFPIVDRQLIYGKDGKIELK